MILPLENGQPASPTKPGLNKPSPTYKVNFRTEWANDPGALDRLNKVDPNKVMEFVSRGLASRPAAVRGITGEQLERAAGKFRKLES